MDVRLLIRQRLAELGLEQKDLAAAAQVTESYVSQLLTRKRMPPAPDRTDIYDKMSRLLKLPRGNLAKLAGLQRQDLLRKSLSEPPTPLFEEVRALVLRKCSPARREQVRAIFERQPFGELERLVTQRLLDVVKRVAKEELESEGWLQQVARASRRRYEDMRVMVLAFLDTDVLNVSVENCVAFLDPLIESWDIDLASFAVEVVLSRRLAAGYAQRFEFVERDAGRPAREEPGFKEFLGNPQLSGDAAREEIAFLRGLRFEGRRPTSLYYYRELQSLRDPLHFRGPAAGDPAREG
ncbi:MAG TPA: helix-turn-helix transcriptional regulator [Vicinamibacteria bacterium]|nr:helix-turn-helix transcriptional regulator [Vicinamibacteria bacterium]